MPGVTPEGFERKTLAQILEDVSVAQKASTALGPSFDTSADTPQGQLNGTLGSIASELWEVLEAVYGAYDPDKAEGSALTALAALTGTERRGAAPSELNCTVNLDAGTTLPVGTIAAVVDRPDIRFELQTEVENTGGVAADFEDTIWHCEQDGPIAVTAGTLTVQVTGISGWNGITNPGDAELGRLEDSDPVLFLRREQQLALRGGSTVRAVVSDMLQVEGVDTARCYENTGDSTDPITFIPAHSIEVLIDDGPVATADDDEVAQAILETKPAGIRAFGAFEGSATDEDDAIVLVSFSRTEHIDVYLAYELTVSSKFPADGIDQVKAAVLAAAANAFDIGDDAVALVLQVAPLTVAGVVDVPSFFLDFTPAPTETANLPISIRQRATFSASNIDVTVA